MKIENEYLGRLLYRDGDPYIEAIKILNLADIGREWIEQRWVYYCSKTEKQLANDLIHVGKYDLSLWISFGFIDRYDVMKVIHDGVRMLLTGTEEKILRGDIGELTPEDHKWALPNQLKEPDVQKVLSILNADLDSFNYAITNKRFYSFGPQDYGKRLCDPSIPPHIRSIYKALSAANKAFRTDVRGNGVIAFQHIMNGFVHNDHAMMISVMDFMATSAAQLIPEKEDESEKELQGEKISAN